MNELKRQLKDALKGELSPLLIGLRNEIKELSRKTDKLIDKKIKETIKTLIVNPEPEVKKVVVENFPEKQKLGFIKTFFTKALEAIYLGNERTHSAIEKETKQADRRALKALRQIYEVKVKNPSKPPKVQDVKVLNQIKQLERVFITNSDPADAIPVVLTSRDRKRFYEVLLSIGGGANLAGVKKQLDVINNTLENLDVTINAGDISIGAVEIKDGDSDTRLDVEADGNKNAAYVQSNSLNQEATQLLIKAELIAISGFVDGIETLLVSLDNKDFSTETTLASLLSAFNSEDFATEATLSAIKGFVDDIEGTLSSIDITLSDLSKAEDSVHVSGDKGIMSLAVRNDARTSLAGDGDYHPQTINDKGETFVKDTDLAAVIGGGAGTTFQKHAKKITSGTSEEDVVTFTVPAGKTSCLREITIEGDADGLFRLKVGATVKWRGRIDQFQSTVHASMSLEALAGVIYKVTVVSKNSSSNEYSATISGTTI